MMKHLMKYLKPYTFRMCVGLVIKFIGTIMDLMLPLILSYLIDTVALKNDSGLIIQWGGVMVLCALVCVATNIIANRMASYVATKCTQQIRYDLFQKISYLSARQVDAFSIPSLEARLTTDTYNINNFISRIQRIGIRAPILLVGGIIITVILEPVLASILIFLLPILGILVFNVSKKGIPLYTKVQESVDIMIGVVRENITGVRVIKALSTSAHEQQRFQKVNSQVVNNEMTAGMTMALSNPLMNLLLNVGLTLVILVGAYRVNLGLTSTGKIIAFLSYFTTILMAMMSITRVFMLISKGTASMNRIAEVLDTPSDLEVQAENIIDSDYFIEFKDVCFGYEKTKDYHLKDISFQLKKGESLGIIGATGCGKSTIIQLLMRMYDKDEGSIRIDGQEVNSIPKEKLHTMFGVVFQNDVIFQDTLRENIAFGREMSDEQIIKATKHAQAYEFISKLEDGLNHPLTSKGTNLSGGQKQRVLLSRALVGNPEILILDDSSSALDYKTDALLRSALKEHYADTTTIIIAQRVSSLMHCEHILVMDEGKCIGLGTHDELMQTCQEYKEISESQMGGGNHG